MRDRLTKIVDFFKTQLAKLKDWISYLRTKGGLEVVKTSGETALRLAGKVFLALALLLIVFDIIGWMIQYVRNNSFQFSFFIVLGFCVGLVEFVRQYRLLRKRAK